MSVKGSRKLNKITIDKDNPEIAYIHIDSPKYGSLKAIIDTANIDLVKNYSWHANIGGGNNRLYIVTHIYKNDKRTLLKLHRLIMNTPKGFDTDHREHNLTLDNRRSNLRVCSRAENARNRGSCKNSTSKYCGVSFDKSTGKFKAEIRTGNKRLHLGYFTSEINAAIAYNNACLKYHKDFSCLNVIP